jgi:hypothetical protein
MIGVFQTYFISGLCKHLVFLTLMQFFRVVIHIRILVCGDYGHDACWTHVIGEHLGARLGFERGALSLFRERPRFYQWASV